MCAKKARHYELVKRFDDSGISDFEQEEILELLLGYVLSDDESERRAKALISRLGSVSAVMDMRVEGLTRVEKLSEKSAILINIIPKIMRRYCIDNLDVKNTVFDHLERIGEYCTARYFGSTDEVLSMMLINERGRFAGYEVVQVGSLASAHVNVEKMAEILFAYDVPYFVLVHNHPDGELLPSEADIKITFWAQKYFKRLGKVMLEHLIVFNNRYMPIIKFAEMEEAGMFDDFSEYYSDDQGRIL